MSLTGATTGKVFSHCLYDERHFIYITNEYCAGFSMPHAGFLFMAITGYSSLQGRASPVAEHRLKVHGFQYLLLAGLVAPRHVGSSRTRNQTCVPCNGRQILIHCAARQVQLEATLKKIIIPWQRYFLLIQWRCTLA